jgi:phage terminase small subunit
MAKSNANARVAASRTLSVKRQCFIREYLIDLNGAGAYKRAGYTVKNDRVARTEAVRLLATPVISAAISDAKQARADRTDITADRVLQELALIGFCDLGQVMDFSGPEARLRPANQISAAARRCIASMKCRRHTEGRGDDALEVEVIEFKLWDKLEALSKMGQHLGLFPTKHEPGRRSLP